MVLSKNNKYFMKRKKIVFLVGGSGLIGKEVEKILDTKFYKVINLDIKKSGRKHIYFDCSKTDTIEHNLNLITRKYQVPDVLINCSYPIAGDWIKNDFNNINQKLMKENLECHLLSYSIISNFVAKKMRKKKRKVRLFCLVLFMVF